MEKVEVSVSVRFLANSLPQTWQILLLAADFRRLLTTLHDLRCFTMLCLYLDAVSQPLEGHKYNLLSLSKLIS